MPNNGPSQDLPQVHSIYVLNQFLSQYMGMSHNFQLSESQRENVLNLQKE